MKMKKLLAFVLALSCMAVSSFSVSAKAISFPDAVDAEGSNRMSYNPYTKTYTADDFDFDNFYNNTITKDGKFFVTAPSCCMDFYLFETDGTSELETDTTSFTDHTGEMLVQSWNDWTNTSEYDFSLLNDFQPEHPENTYRIKKHENDKRTA